MDRGLLSQSGEELWPTASLDFFDFFVKNGLHFYALFLVTGPPVQPIEQI